MQRVQHDYRLAIRALLARLSALSLAGCWLRRINKMCTCHLVQEQAYEASQKYKEGKYIVEKIQLFKARMISVTLSCRVLLLGVGGVS